VTAAAGQTLRLALTPQGSDTSLALPVTVSVVGEWPPRIVGISPTRGPAAGGTAVNLLLWTSSLELPSVRCSGTPAEPVQLALVSSNGSMRLELAAPPHAAGLTDVTVTDRYGTAVLAGGFLYDDAAGFEPQRGFFTLSPCRALDTRGADGPALAARETRTLRLTGACGIPSTAAAVLANVTVTEPLAAGELVIYPADADRPASSSISFPPGKFRANNTPIKLAADGSGTAKVANLSDGPVHLVVDVNGWFQ
jgi:hypothetical protein